MGTITICVVGINLVLLVIYWMLSYAGYSNSALQVLDFFLRAMSFYVVAFGCIFLAAASFILGVATLIVNLYERHRHRFGFLFSAIGILAGVGTIIALKYMKTYLDTFG